MYTYMYKPQITKIKDFGYLASHSMRAFAFVDAIYFFCLTGFCYLRFPILLLASDKL